VADGVQRNSQPTTSRHNYSLQARQGAEQGSEQQYNY
jgi:hypothetical protein